MVKETRILFGIDDIVALRIGCSKCKGEIVIKLDSGVRIPEVCPQCDERWSDGRSRIVAESVKVMSKYYWS